MVGRMIRQFTHAYASSMGRGDQCGGVSLTVALMISAALLTGVTVVQKFVLDKESQETKSAKHYYLEGANEAALALGAQLLGNNAIILNGSRFVLNSSMPGSIVGNSENWTISSNGINLQIKNCVKPNPTSTANGVFDNNNVSVAAVACAPGLDAMTMITVSEVIPSLSFSGINNGAADRYVIVNAETNGAGTKFTKKARLRFTEATKVCEVNGGGTSAAACNVDHCRFVKPLVDTSNNIMYKASGAPEITINEAYSERIQLTTSPSQTAIARSTGQDPPVDLWAFYQQAYTNGRIDPFRSWQSIQPNSGTRNYVNAQPDGTVWLEVPNSPNGVPTGTRGVPVFDGFLYCGNLQAGCPGGSSAVAWPKGYRYSNLQPYFKAGCARTIGDSSPDACARINVNIKGIAYTYDKRRMCYFDGPEDYPSFLETGLRSWNKSSEEVFQSFSNWGASKQTRVGESIISDQRKVWSDDMPHQDFGPAPLYALNTWTPHRFNDIKVGEVKVREVKKEMVPAPNPDDPPVVTFLERTKTYNWSTRCDYRQPTANDSYEKDFTVCFYLAYYNIENRNTCQRLTSSYICRNSNGCFVAGTKIQMADGTERNIEDVRAGDMIYNPSTKSSAKVKNIVVGEETHALYKIVYGDKTVTATYNHPFVTKQGMKQAEKLKVGEILLDKNIGQVRISKITKMDPPKGTLVWNLILSGQHDENAFDFNQHTFVANGLMSGDYFIQQAAGVIDPEAQRFTEFLRSRGMSDSVN